MMLRQYYQLNTLRGFNCTRFYIIEIAARTNSYLIVSLLRYKTNENESKQLFHFLSERECKWGEERKKIFITVDQVRLSIYSSLEITNYNRRQS